MYRSLLLPLIVLSTSVSALCVALLIIWHLADAGVLLLSGQTQGILFILVIGAATDYSLLYVARYRDELRARRSAGRPRSRRCGHPRARARLRRHGHRGLLCLLLSDLKSNSTLSPVAAIPASYFAMPLRRLTFTALLYVTGRVAFWPRRPHYAPEHRMPVLIPAHGIWGGSQTAVRRRPRPLWILTAIVLAVVCLGATQLKADGVPQSDLVLAQSSARDGQVGSASALPRRAGLPRR